MSADKLSDYKSNLITPVVPVKSPHRVECLWHFDLKATPAQLWPYISDTSRMNRDLGLPPWKEETHDGVLHVESVSMGRLQKWIERPWIWVEPKEIQNHRIFSQGWMTEQRGVYTLTPLENGMCRVGVYFQWGFGTVWTQWLFQLASGLLKKKFAEFFGRTENIIQNTLRYRAAKTHSAPTDEERKRIDEIYAEMSGSSAADSVARDMLTYLVTADEMDLDKVRVKRISEELNVPLAKVLRSAHSFVEKGYLYLAWDLVCPHCRGAVASEKNLADISDKNSCAACDVEFAIDQEESVEVVFHLTSKLRTISAQEYCAAEPAKKKHIKMFQTLGPRQKHRVEFSLKPGKYRIRSSGDQSYCTLEVAADRGTGYIVWPSGFSGQDATVVQTNFSLELRNESDAEVSVTFEEVWWANDRLLPGEILSYPEFRKFFSKDHLSAGVKLFLGNQVLLFTDIVGSTPLYRELGDARAFEAVRRHYSEITEGIAESRGVLIKFIGDAVMAAFLDLEDAFRAAVAIQKKFAPQSMKIRISMNYGPVLCANLNVGLDYFGTTVNTAAKIQKWGGSQQIITTQSIWDEVKETFGPQVSAVESLRDDKLDVDVVILTIE